MRLGTVLADYRRAHDIDQKDLARLIGISAASLCRIETGKSNGDAVSLGRILTWLFADATPRRKQEGA